MSSDRGLSSLGRALMYHRLRVAQRGHTRAQVQQNPRYHFIKSL